MSDVKPALTAKQWSQVLRNGGRNAVQIFAECATTPEDQHYLAALALHGQSFGFRWEDADLLRHVGAALGAIQPDVVGIFGKNRDRVISLADRIEALLPPREP